MVGSGLKILNGKHSGHLSQTVYSVREGGSNSLVWDFNIWRFPYHINKPSSVPIRLWLFKWGQFNIFTLSYNLTSDNLQNQYVTTNLINILNDSIWFDKPRLVSIWTSILHEANFIFSGHLTIWPLMTLDLAYDLRPHWQMRGPMLHPWPKFGWNPSTEACGRYSQMLTFFHTTTEEKAIPMCLSC